MPPPFAADRTDFGGPLAIHNRTNGLLFGFCMALDGSLQLLSMVEEEDIAGLLASEFAATTYILMQLRWIHDDGLVADFLNGSDQLIEARRRQVAWGIPLPWLIRHAPVQMDARFDAAVTGFGRGADAAAVMGCSSLMGKTSCRITLPWLPSDLREKQSADLYSLLIS
ncbi:hypothetical protein ACLOJK_029592 [Asimina triloba]